MSTPLKLSAADLARASAFLAALTAATVEHDVFLGPYTDAQMRIAEDAVVTITWNAGRNEYVIDDQNGN